MRRESIEGASIEEESVEGESIEASPFLLAWDECRKTSAKPRWCATHPVHEEMGSPVPVANQCRLVRYRMCSGTQKHQML